MSQVPSKPWPQHLTRDRFQRILALVLQLEQLTRDGLKWRELPVVPRGLGDLGNSKGMAYEAVGLPPAWRGIIVLAIVESGTKPLDDLFFRVVPDPGPAPTAQLCFLMLLDRSGVMIDCSKPEQSEVLAPLAATVVRVAE